jgi:hypothetical protein
MRRIKKAPGITRELPAKEDAVERRDVPYVGHANYDGATWTDMVASRTQPFPWILEMLENVREYQAIEYFSRKDGGPVNGVDVALDDLVESGPGMRAEHLVRIYTHYGSTGNRPAQGFAQFSITAADVQDPTRVWWNELEDVGPKARICGLTVGRHGAAGH